MNQIARFLILPVLLSLAACDDVTPDQPMLAVFHASLNESSGLAPNPLSPGQWFTHNDSGGAPELFAFDLEGGAVARYPVIEAEAVDWEDMAAGPCPESNAACLYVADFGDNRERRKRVRIYAVSIPQPDAPAEVLATWRVKYPDGPRNAEALLVHPVSGEITIVSKSDDGRSEVLRVPAQTGKVTAQKLTAIQIDGPDDSDRLVTGGDWSPDGTRLVLRTYTAAYEWSVDADTPDAHWQKTPTKIQLPLEQQGEAIAYLPDGRLLTSSEGQPMGLNIVTPQRSDPVH